MVLPEGTVHKLNKSLEGHNTCLYSIQVQLLLFLPSDTYLFHVECFLLVWIDRSISLLKPKK